MFAPLSTEPAARQRECNDSRPRPVVPVPPAAPDATFRHREHGEPSQVWAYRDAVGALLGYVCRFEGTDGGKEILPRTYCEANGERAWHWHGWDTPRPLYGLDRLAARPDVVVVAVEGEKTADAAGQLFAEEVAITSPGGSKAAGKVDWSILHGRVVIVWPDADAAGARYAADVARLARAAAAADVRVVELPAELTEGWDLADPLPHGWTVDTLRELLASARPAPDADSSEDPASDTISDVLERAGLSALPDSPRAVAVEAALRMLADLLRDADLLRRAVVRNAASDLLKARKVTSPTALVDAALGTVASMDATGAQGAALTLSDPEPWPDAVDGAALVDEIARAHARYVVLPDGAADVAALWDLHTYLPDVLHVSPILELTSPQKRCGKSTHLDVHRALVRRPVGASNISAAALFRVVEMLTPTLLIDEADTFLREREELRGILNAGHTRSTAQVVRTVGDDHEPRVFRTFCPKAIAAIGELPGTIEDRAIIVRMKRRAPGEHVERLRRDRIESELEPLRRKAARWAADNGSAVRDADPNVPTTLNDRAADNWRPLLAIADAAGADWPTRARQAAMLLSGAVVSEDSDVRVQLLSDVRDMFDRAERIASEVLVEQLTKLDNRPWGEWRRGKPITANSLARLLKPFGIRSKQVWLNGANVHGYERVDFMDAWARYLPATGESIETLETLEPLRDKRDTQFSQPLDRAQPSGLKNAEKAMCDKGSSVLADGNGDLEEGVVP